MSDALSELTTVVIGGVNEHQPNARESLDALFGGRYQKRHWSKTAVRDALGMAASDDDSSSVPFAGLIHPDNPPSGPYGGASLVWFPTGENGSLIGLLVGTRGLSPDEGLLTRPGHRRRVAAFRRMLAAWGVECWTKPDPSNLGVSVPQTVRERFPGFEKTFQRYGREMYCLGHVHSGLSEDVARGVVGGFLDLYSYERGWDILAPYREEREGLLSLLRGDLFDKVTCDQVFDRLKARHFVVLQGPPGTGKTRLAEEVCRRCFEGKGATVQFHPAVTYEDFVVGLSPDVTEQQSLRFHVEPGWLLEACERAREAPYLLIIDEINRADLGKILGEAIYLFEAGEIGQRRIHLSHAVNGSRELTIPDNLYVLGTMNTADRSIARVDLAIRRRFTFITMMPDRDVVAAQHLPLADHFYDRICDVFVEHAPSDVLDLMPGHSYFLAPNERELKGRFRYELLPLLDEYLKEGYLGPATTELSAVRDAIEDAVR